MDELFQHLYEADLSSMSLHRAFDTDVRKQRTFVFNFEYFTLIGKECQPMKWQLAAGQEDRKPGTYARLPFRPYVLARLGPILSIASSSGCRCLACLKLILCILKREVAKPTFSI